MSERPTMCTAHLLWKLTLLAKSLTAESARSKLRTAKSEAQFDEWLRSSYRTLLKASNLEDTCKFSGKLDLIMRLSDDESAFSDGFERLNRVLNGILETGNEPQSDANRLNLLRLFQDLEERGDASVLAENKSGGRISSAASGGIGSGTGRSGAGVAGENESGGRVSSAVSRGTRSGTGRSGAGVGGENESRGGVSSASSGGTGSGTGRSTVLDDVGCGGDKSARADSSEGTKTSSTADPGSTNDGTSGSGTTVTTTDKTKLPASTKVGGLFINDMEIVSKGGKVNKDLKMKVQGELVDEICFPIFQLDGKPVEDAIIQFTTKKRKADTSDTAVASGSKKTKTDSEPELEFPETGVKISSEMTKGLTVNGFELFGENGKSAFGTGKDDVLQMTINGVPIRDFNMLRLKINGVVTDRVELEIGD